MRHVLVAITISTAATVSAQPVAHGAAPPVPSFQTHGASRSDSSPSPPQPATVAPPIVLPMPPLMTPPAGGLTQGFPFTSSDPTKPPRDLYRAQRQSPRRPRITFPAGGGYVGSAEPAPAPAPEAGAAPQLPATGLLRLSVTPATAQVFVDSYYVGTVDDLDGRPLTLVAGPHRIEIRAPGHQTLSVDVRIEPGATLTYRGALESTRPAAPERERPSMAPTSPMYVIQNCYLGNVPPRPQRLPPGCDIKNVQILGVK